ncbi:phosphoribosylglycinamide formyltransferase [Propioniciclava sinopodophylli]|uniref:phosphoribosylglycinamide formyltransferase n=1 Tax=Propioniciclava sinopodophylli TaxID=1837344 RepID=UPI0024914B30|nr:phosphoribosylglycinamide formyltransferase [Propioniciclava sinopodophylli]
MTLRLLVLVSGSGTLLQALLDAQAFGRLDAAVVAVGADRACTGLERAAAAGVPTFTVRLGDHRDAEAAVDRASFDEALTRACAEHDPDLIVSAGFMKLVGEAFLARFGGRMINTHPALLPSFPGAHGVRDALEYGVKVTGCTVFEVDAGVDTGRIIDQVAVRVEPGDDEESLHERIKVAERRLLVETVNALAASR